jgi:tetratricopeptide (TPR) repeat protein
MNSHVKIRLGVSLAMLVSTSFALMGQTPGQRLKEALNLEKEGKPAQAVAEARAVLDSNSLSAFETGKAWNILGLAYEDQGDIQPARHAFEESIRILEPLPSVRDYAMAVDGLGGVYVATGQFEDADKLRTKAVGLYETAGDHGGIAMASSDLALSAFRQDKVSRGKKYLERALKESRGATDIDNDDRAAIASLEGWKAWHDGEYSTSVAKYRQALDFLRSIHGEDHPSIGWAHVQLGDADVAAGHLKAALTETKEGLDTLDRSLGRQNPHYLLAELAYARVLDASGSHSQAAPIRATAESMLKENDRRQCPGCTVNAMALR